jgi:hypothetical protein
MTKKLDKLELALRLIANCSLCEGKGTYYYGNGEDYYDAESCECNIYDIILDADGDVIYDNGLSSESELSIFATAEAN